MLASTSKSVCCSQRSLLSGTQVAVVPICHKQRRSVSASVQKKESSFFDSVQRLAKQVQGALPIVGLVSRWTSPEGGFGEMAYPEFARYTQDHCSPGFMGALMDFEKKNGKLASSRWVMLVLWMCKYGVGLVPNKDIMNAARRMRVTQDIEIEIDRFEGTKEATLKKYPIMERPEGKPADKVNMAVDTIATLCLGLKDGVAVPEDNVAVMVTIIREAIPEADAELVTASIRNREQRATAYA